MPSSYKDGDVIEDISSPREIDFCGGEEWMELDREVGNSGALATAMGHRNLGLCITTSIVSLPACIAPLCVDTRRPCTHWLHLPDVELLSESMNGPSE